jgi:hypothetical protein
MSDAKHHATSGPSGNESQANYNATPAPRRNRFDSLEAFISRYLAARRARYGRHAGQHYPSDETRICAVCWGEFTRPSRMGLAPATCRPRCANALSRRIARHGRDGPLVDRAFCERKCEHCDEWLEPEVRSDARFCSARCRVAAHRSREP